MPGKLTRTFSLTETTDELLAVLSRIDQRPRSAELRYMIIKYAEDCLSGNPNMRRDIRKRLEHLVDEAKSEVYEPDDGGDEHLSL